MPARLESSRVLAPRPTDGRSAALAALAVGAVSFLWEVLSPAERATFQRSVQLFAAEIRQYRQMELLQNMPLGPKVIATIRRVAISLALTTHRLLFVQRRRFVLPQVDTRHFQVGIFA